MNTINYQHTTVKIVGGGGEQHQRVPDGSKVVMVLGSQGFRHLYTTHMEGLLDVHSKEMAGQGLEQLSKTYETKDGKEREQTNKLILSECGK
jgi:hypothetical protein